MRAQLKTWWGVSLSWMLMAVMAMHPALLYADAFVDAARNGQGFADTIGISGPADVNNGTISFGDGDSISVQELFPDSSAGPNGSANYPHMRPQDELEGEADSDSGLSGMGGDALSSMRSEVTRPGGPSSIQGMAYEVVHKAGDLSRPDFSNDPMLDRTRDVYDGMETFANDFADCSVDSSIHESSFETHLPDYQRCTVVDDRSSTCQIRHNYEARVLTHYGGPVNLDSCGEGCLNTWIGRVGDNYWRGNCSIFEEFTEIQVDNPDAITSAILNRAKWDDYMQIYLGEPGSEQLIWESHPGRFPPETAGQCELSNSWDRNPNLDLTHIFKGATPGQVLRFKIRVSVTGEGEGYGRINIQFDPNKTIVEDTWSPDECLGVAEGIEDGFAYGDISCTDNPADANGCVSTNGVTICSDMLAPSPIPGISNMCRNVNVEASYDFYKGDMQCWLDANGEETCITNEGGNLNSCQALQDNPQCGFISSQCVEGAEGESGRCYVREETYDCGTSQTVPTLERESSYQCGGPIRCMGSECFEHTAESSPDFARAAAMLNAAQFMGSDLACTGTTDEDGIIGDENVQCEVFQGTAGECKKAVGGVVDCCEAPAGINLGDYLQMIMTVPKIDSGIMSLQGTPANSVFGAYNTLREPVMNSWSSVTQPFTSRLENVSGAWDTMTGTVQDKVLELTGPLREKVAEMTGDVIFGAAESAGTSVGEGLGGEAAQSFSEQLLGQGGAQFLSTAMTAYQIYVATMLAIQLIWKCETEEFEMNAQRELKSCHYVGSYCKTKVLGQCIEQREAHCCFTSPLSRIMQEQVRLQTGQGWGSAESPQCGGIPVDTLASIDWDAVNLDEWLAILASEGMYAGSGALDIESLTGVGTALDVGERTNTADRTMNRFDGIDIDQSRREAQDTLRTN